MPVPLYAPGAPLTEFVFETVIRDGLNELRVNPTKFDDLFGRFLQTHFGNQYGQEKIDEIKTYFTSNQVKITQAFSQVPKVTPCISIQMIRSNEEPGMQYLGDEFGELDTDVTPRIVVPTVTPTTYEASTGRLKIADGADLSLVCPGMVFVDGNDNKFSIKSGNSNLVGNKFISLDKNQTVNIALAGRIESKINFKREDIRSVKLREVVSLGCHAADNLHLAKFLYMVLIYILSSRKDSLIQRGIGLSMGDAQLFDRETEYNNENIYSRYVNVQCLTDFTWNQGEVNLIDCFDATIKAPDPNPDSIGKVVISPDDSDDC